MTNFIQFTPCGALIVCVLAWIRIAMLSHKIDELERKITLLMRASFPNPLPPKCKPAPALET
jgi:hypothetical protein